MEKKAKPKKKRRHYKPQIKVKVVDSEWLSTEEAQAYLRLRSKGALYQLVYRNLLPAYRLGKKSLIFSRSELDQHIRSQRVVRPDRPSRRKEKPS